MRRTGLADPPDPSAGSETAGDMLSRPKRGSSAWLIEWQWDGAHARRLGSRFLVLSPRLGTKTVAGIVGALYSQEWYTADEQASFALQPEQMPYKVSELDPGRLTCGHNPYLFARKVDGLQVATDDRGIEYVSYNERKVPRLRFEVGADGVRSPIGVDWLPGRRVDMVPVIER